jgi:rod shape-determining protein MreC
MVFDVVMRSRRLLYFLIIVLLPVLVFLKRPAVTEPVRVFSLSVLKPALVIGEAVAGAVSSVFAGFSDFWDSFHEQGVLKGRINLLESELLRFEEMERENSRLKNLLDFKNSIKGKTIPARVIGWDTSPWRKIVILDKGIRHGIRKNMAVVVPEGLAGRVFEVGPETATALLLSDPESRVSVLSDLSRTQGMIAGNSSLRLEMSYIDPDSELSVDETVISSGVGGVFPKGIRIGRVNRLFREPGSLHLGAGIQPFVNFSRLEEVLCIERYPAE